MFCLCLLPQSSISQLQVVKMSAFSLSHFNHSTSAAMSAHSSAPTLAPAFHPFSVASSIHISSTPSNQTGCHPDDTNIRLPLIAFYSIFFILGLVGNIFALWVFLFLQSSRNSVRVFLINCAVADLVLLACLPFRIFYHVNGNKWVLGPVACKLVGNLFYMNMYISILLLGLISLDRYLRLKGKSKARRRLTMKLWGQSWPWSWLVCGIVWSLSLMTMVFMIATAEDSEDTDRCFQYKKRRKVQGKAYFNGVLVVLFWLVFVMLVISYIKIASQLLRASRDKPGLPNAQKYKCTAKKSFFVLFVFSVCFGPYHTFRPIYILTQLSDTVSCDYLQLVDHTNEVMLLLSAFNSCLDPVMYFLLSGSVRKTALQAVGHRLGNRLPFWNDGTSNSSTTEFRRSSVAIQGMALVLPNPTPQNDNLPPSTGPCG